MSLENKSEPSISPAAEHFVQPIMLSFPVIHIATFEPARAEIVVREATEKVGKVFINMPLKMLPNPVEIKKLIAQGKSDADKANNGKKFKGVVIFDAFFFDRQKLNPENLPSLKSSVGELETGGANYVIASRDSFSEEFVYSMDLQRMSLQEIYSLIDECSGYIQEAVKDNKKEGTTGAIFSNEEKAELANNALGIPYAQIRNVFTLSAFHKLKGNDYLGKVRAEKAAILREVGIDVMQPVDIESVGGLENVKQFLFERKAGWNLDLPVKGILLAGVPGGGKSLIAKSAASILGTSLVRLEIGRFYDKHLGETEKQFTRALQTIEMIAPVVVLIDEIEKVLGGGGDGDHEVSRRLLGRFLTWLQDRTAKVFIVATANKVTQLPPELIRAGRWDQSFYIDLPNDSEREKIFQIHLKKWSIPVDPLNLTILVACTEGFTGAEIEQCVNNSLFIAAKNGCKPNFDIVNEVLKRVTPASKSNGFDSVYMDALHKMGFAPASNNEAQIAANIGRNITVD
ncbi:MAG: AAA family ATPase [Gammaproteobacteria bacterium]|nr:MAG: AAA family ATPase [Gammaproteobacteria bacterium]